MIEIAGTLLYTTDGRLVLHRRDKKAVTSPNKLGLFGGHAEAHETALETARRELAEEISLDVNSLTLDFIAEFEAFNSYTQQKVHFTTFKSIVPHTDFEVFEGVGLEVYSVEEALKRSDLTDSTRTTIVKAQEMK